MKNKLLTLAAGLTLVVMAGKFFAVPLLAQVRAALVQNVDERGRIPYQATYLNTTCLGNLFHCDYNFAAIPNNKRLVITHFDAAYQVNNFGGLQDVVLSTAGICCSAAYPEFTAGAPSSGNNSFSSSRVIEYYVDAGNAVKVHVDATDFIIPIARLTLTGYLLDCTSGCAAIAQ
jgi:hypothetical protein